MRGHHGLRVVGVVRGIQTRGVVDVLVFVVRGRLFDNLLRLDLRRHINIGIICDRRRLGHERHDRNLLGGRVEQALLHSTADRQRSGVLLHHVDVEVDRCGVGLVRRRRGGFGHRGDDRHRAGVTADARLLDRLTNRLFVVLGLVVVVVVEIGSVAAPQRVVSVTRRRTAAAAQPCPDPAVEHAGGQRDVTGAAHRVALVDEHRDQHEEPKHHE